MKQGKPIKPPTEERLRNSAIHYLQRYSSSKENLRRVLQRKVQRAARALELDPRDFDKTIAAVVAHCQDLGLIDDAAYAESRVAGLRRRGRSANRIRMTLEAKGVAPELAAEALQQNPADDFTAAVNFARRRRFGPWRKGADEPKQRERELAALCRAGFGYALARRIIEASDIHEFDEQD